MKDCVLAFGPSVAGLAGVGSSIVFAVLVPVVPSIIVFVAVLSFTAGFPFGRSPCVEILTKELATLLRER